MRRLKFVLLLLFVCGVRSLWGGTIALSMESYYDATRACIVWQLTNHGDSLVDALVVTARPAWGASVWSESTFLDGGDTVRGILPMDLTSRCPGQYQVPLYMDYQDGTGKAHQTLAWTQIFWGVDATHFRAPLTLGMGGRPRADERVTEAASPSRAPRLWQYAVVVNSDVSETLEATLTVEAPAGFGVIGENPRRLTVEPYALQWVEIGLTNAMLDATLSGSFPLSVRVEGETAEGLHYSHVASTTLQVDAVHPSPQLDLPVRWPKAVTYVLCGIGVLLGLLGIRKTDGWKGFESKDDWIDRGLDATLLVLITVYLLWLLHAPLVFLDTLCVGGDTPAHHYLVAQIRESHRIVSWAPGWWSGFPMFRFYFPLPYTVMTFFSSFLPHNVVFKMGSIAGLVALPWSLYWAGCLMRLKRPAPILLACLAVPLICDNTHSMWGVNAYSTLAGMIANSWSFALFAPTMAMACRDAMDRRLRTRTVWLLAALVLSHFFTSLMAAMVLGCVALWKGLRRAGWTLLWEGLWVAGLVAWWVVPLYFRSAWSVDFGSQWNILFWKQLAPLAREPLGVILASGAVLGVGRWIQSWKSRRERVEFPKMGARCVLCESEGDGLWLMVHLLLVSLSIVLFYFGRSGTDVFVNCRFWPFIVYALLVVGAMVLAWMSRVGRIGRWASVCFLSLCLSFAWREGGPSSDPIWSRHNHIRLWAESNFRGLEAIREGDVVKAIAEAVRGTNGRFSQDMHPGHEALGSSRVFEALPYLSDKPILEGGIVNSALGSLVAYTVQCEISQYPAGWPLLVEPTGYRPHVGLRHLEFLNVRHFVARSHRVQHAFEQDSGWQFVAGYGNGKWKLYKSTLASDSPIRIWREPLPQYRTTDFQRDLLAWCYAPGAMVRPVVLLTDGQVAPASGERIPAGQYREWLKRQGDEPPTAGWLDAVSEPCEDYTNFVHGGLRFRTTALGKPHVIAVSAYADWTVRGATGVYWVAPGYCCVYPTETDVELVIRRPIGEWIVMVLSGVFAVALIVKGLKLWK